MLEDFYCNEVLSGKTPVDKVLETDNVLAYHHTRPFYPVHIVVIPKRHIASLLTLEQSDNDLLLELFEVIRKVAADITVTHGACRVLTNLGNYQDSKHLHFQVAYGEPLILSNKRSGVIWRSKKTLRSFNFKRNSLVKRRKTGRDCRTCRSKSKL